ncbi:MAG: hypothetical protein AB7V08_08650 [Elusimicrobiales bacterium]
MKRPAQISEGIISVYTLSLALGEGGWHDAYYNTAFLLKLLGIPVPSRKAFEDLKGRLIAQIPQLTLGIYKKASYRQTFEEYKQSIEYKETEAAKCAACRNRAYRATKSTPTPAAKRRRVARA